MNFHLGEFIRKLYGNKDILEAYLIAERRQIRRILHLSTFCFWINVFLSLYCK